VVEKDVLEELKELEDPEELKEEELEDIN